MTSTARFDNWQNRLGTQAGSIDASGNVTFDNDVTVSGGSTVSGDLTVDTSTLHVDSTNNRVGIGDTTPSYKLDVNGDINATGNLRIAGTAIGERQSYTPTVVAGGSLGNGTLTGYYVRIQNFVMFFVTFTLGSTSTITGDLQISAPPGLNFGPNDLTSATGLYTDLSTSAQYLGAVRPFGTSLYCRVLTDDYGAGGAYVSANTAMSSIVPFQWSTGDIMAASGITVFA